MRSAKLAIRVVQVVVLAAIAAAFAVEFLRERPPAENLGALLLALKSPDTDTRRDAALGLRRLRLSGDAASPVAIALGDCLNDRDEGVCEAAVDVLVGLGPGAAPAVPAALRLSRGTPENVRARALLVLAVVGTPEGEEALESALSDADTRVRLQAVHAVTVARRPALIPMVIRRLKVEPDAEVRMRAHRALAATDRHSDPVLDAECLGLRDPDPSIRREVATTLRNSRSPRVEVAEALGGAIHDPDPQVRRIAYDALVAIGLGQARALSVLFQATKESATRDEARDAVKRLRHSDSVPYRPDPERMDSRRASYPTLLRALEDPAPWLRGAVAEFVVSYLATLERMCGSECQADRADLASAVTSRLKSQDRAVRRSVLLELLSNYPSKSLLPLFGTLMETDEESTSTSAGASRRQGNGSEVSDFLASLSRDEPAPVRESLLRLLPDGLLRRLLPEIRECLLDEDRNSRYTAFYMVRDLLLPRNDLFPAGGTTRHWMLEAMQGVVKLNAMADEASWVRQELEIFHRDGREIPLMH